MSLSKFESMLKTNSVYFFDSVEFEDIIQHYLDNGKHSLAKKAVKLGLEQHPTSVMLMLFNVDLLIIADKFNDALALIQELALIEPTNDVIFLQKGIIFSKKGAHFKAIESFNKALEFSPEPEEVWSLLGMEYLYLDDFENARFNFEKCLEVDFDDYSALYNLIYCFDMDNDAEGAIKYLNSYIDQNPYCEVAWHQLGRQYFTLKKYKKALTSFDYSVLIDEFFIGGYLEKAKTLEKLERYQEAIENYLYTIELDDPTAFSYIRIGECYSQLNEPVTAIKYYKKAVHEDPLLDKGWILLTNAYYNEKDYQKALFYIGKAIQIDENNALYWRKYADINLQLDFFEEAVRAFHRCIHLNDVAIEIYIGLADVLVFLGDFNDALSVLVKAKKTYRQFAEIEYRLCGLFYVLDNKEFSFIHFKNGLAIDVEYHTVLKELFPTVFEDANIQKIIANFKKATE